MPLTKKGDEIMSNMKKEYGAKEGEKVFYASRNSGRISGVDGLVEGAAALHQRIADAAVQKPYISKMDGVWELLDMHGKVVASSRDMGALQPKLAKELAKYDTRSVRRDAADATPSNPYNDKALRDAYEKGWAAGGKRHGYRSACPYFGGSEKMAWEQGFDARKVAASRGDAEETIKTLGHGITIGRENGKYYWKRKNTKTFKGSQSEAEKEAQGYIDMLEGRADAKSFGIGDRVRIGAGVGRVTGFVMEKNQSGVGPAGGQFPLAGGKATHMIVELTYSPSPYSPKGPVREEIPIKEFYRLAKRADDAQADAGSLPDTESGAEALGEGDWHPNKPYKNPYPRNHRLHAAYARGWNNYDQNESDKHAEGRPNRIGRTDAADAVDLPRSSANPAGSWWVRGLPASVYNRLRVGQVTTLPHRPERLRILALPVKQPANERETILDVLVEQAARSDSTPVDAKAIGARLDALAEGVHRLFQRTDAAQRADAGDDDLVAKVREWRRSLFGMMYPDIVRRLAKDYGISESRARAIVKKYKDIEGGAA